MTGFLLIDKPAGMTSHDVVDRVRRLTGERRVGHAGTLDPFATGLLIVGVGREATREMEKLVGLHKTYEAEFVLGGSSDTDDVTGQIVPCPPTEPLTPSGVQVALKQFVGEIEQVPPTYSAIKIGGKKMYEEARKGNPLEVRPRKVQIYALSAGNAIPSTSSDNNVAGVEGITFSLTIHCSSGTYIRAIARDLGRALGTGGYVKTLRRTKIGPFALTASATLQTLQSDGPEPHLTPISELLQRL